MIRPLKLAPFLLKLLAFHTAATRLGFREREIEIKSGDTPRVLLARINPSAVSLAEMTRVAIDLEYSSWDGPIPDTAREIAIIPPVSGG